MTHQWQMFHLGKKEEKKKRKRERKQARVHYSLVNRPESGMPGCAPMHHLTLNFAASLLHSSLYSIIHLDALSKQCLNKHYSCQRKLSHELRKKFTCAGALIFQCHPAGQYRQVPGPVAV